MTSRLTVRRQAKADVREAARWYERERQGLGRAFLHQIDVLLDRIREDPLQHQVVYRGVRRAIPRRCPYSLFYRIEGSAILVFAVVHPHRDPSTWQDRDPIPGALNVSAKPDVPMSLYVSDVKEIERLVGGDKTKSLVLYCNGPYCGRSKRLSEELLGAGFSSVRRYQLGIPVWRALGGLTQIQLEGVTYIHASDRTAVFLDARDPQEFSAGTLSGARNVPASGLKLGKDVGEVKKAKDDGRLPMEDHNTRIVVFGRDGAQARLVAEAVVNEAFHNVAFYDGPFATIKAAAR